MITIPTNAQVVCTDGLAGQSINVIINPVTRQVTHFVAKSADIEYLVPTQYIEETTPDSILLTCTKDELQKMASFIEERYIKNDVTVYDSGGTAYAPYVAPRNAAKLKVVKEQRIPAGELAVHRGTEVRAKDGDAGYIDEFILDPESGEITHMILRKGHAFGKKEIALPLSAIDAVLGDAVYLKLDKRAIDTLPAIPVQRPWEDISITEVELLVSTFEAPHKAQQALTKLQELEQAGDLDVLNAAIITKNATGKTSIRESGDVNPRRGALFGAITGGLMGLLGGPVGAVVGAVAGAATGGVAANKIDLGFPDKFLEAIQAGLQPDSSAVVLLIDQDWVVEVTRILDEFGGQLLRQTISDEKIAQLLKQSGQ